MQDVYSLVMVKAGKATVRELQLGERSPNQPHHPPFINGSPLLLWESLVPVPWLSDGYLKR